jgi:hypothetical protein
VVMDVPCGKGKTMDGEEVAKRRAPLVRLLTLGAGTILLVLLVTPGDAAPGVHTVSPFATIAVQEMMAVNVVGMSGHGCSCVHIPHWPKCRSPWKPPWKPGPPPWRPGPPSWRPGPPPWRPSPPWWRSGPPSWGGRR